MSRAKAVAEREPLDFYATPDALAEGICRSVWNECEIAPALVVEPSAGHGPFVRAARKLWPTAEVVAVDVSPERLPALSDAGAHAVLVSDWLGVAALPFPDDGTALIVGNPPYREAEAHVRHALHLMRDDDRLAFLLRLNFLGSVARVPLWNVAGLETVEIIVPRPSFTGGGTDGTEYALFVWRKGWTCLPSILPPLVWRQP